MSELLKIVIRFVYFSIARRFQRLTEDKIALPDGKRERYPSKLAEISNTQDDKTQQRYCGVRINHPSEKRFSILFPGSLNRSERDYFLAKSWVNYFDDDRRQGEASRGEGYLIHWSKESVGAKELMPTCWKFIMQLPFELIEVHQTPEHLRLLFVGASREIIKIDTNRVRSLLLEFAQAIDGLVVVDAKRGSLNDRIPIFAFLLNGIILFGFVLLIVLVMPAVDYFDYQKTDDIVIGSALVFAIFVVGYQMIKGSGLMNSIRKGVMTSFFFTMTILALYQRYNYFFRTDGRVEIWRVLKIEERKGKFGTKRTGYQVTLLSDKSRWDHLFVRESKFANMALPTKGTIVRMNIFSDILGFYYADSVRIYPSDVNDDDSSIELL